MKFFHRQPSTVRLHLLYLVNHNSPIHVMARLFIMNGFSSKCIYVIVYIWWGIPQGFVSHGYVVYTFDKESIKLEGKPSKRYPQDPQYVTKWFWFGNPKPNFPRSIYCYTFISQQEILVKTFPIHCHICLGRRGYYNTSIGFFTVSVQRDIVVLERITVLDLRIVRKFYSPYLALITT